jgi:hypothetical protein
MIDDFSSQIKFKMEKLIDVKDDVKFYSGTIIVLKDAHISPTGTFDIKYCMVYGPQGAKFTMLDLYKSVGRCIWLDLKPNVEGHFAVDKIGIKEWVTLYFNTFYTEEGKEKWIPMIDEICYIENLGDYFKQVNRDLFIP